MGDDLARGEHNERVLGRLDVVRLPGEDRRDPVAESPEAAGELHSSLVLSPASADVPGGSRAVFCIAQEHNVKRFAPLRRTRRRSPISPLTSSTTIDRRSPSPTTSTG